MMISDEAVKNLFEKCMANLSQDELDLRQNVPQFLRGITSRCWKKNLYPGYCCQRHLKVFNEFGVIPEYCFGCYKILIVPRTVLELFKLMIVFDSIELPENNTRKCMLEVRPKITGNYKGYIYYQDLGKAKDILPFIKDVIAENISRDIQVEIKRGCSEYKLAFPDYDYNSEDESKMLTYREDWKKYEDYVDKYMLGDIKAVTVETYGAKGMSVRDVLVMRTWIAFAATIGDMSYKKITDRPEWEIQWIKESRPRFQSIQ